MFRRKKMNRRKSGKYFSRNAKSNSRNMRANPMRGGYRI